VKIGSLLTRRSLLSGGLGALGAFTACSRPKAKGFSGYAFIANQEGGAVAAVDLEVFAVPGTFAWMEPLPTWWRGTSTPVSTP
jgi:hypothetical protein